MPCYGGVSIGQAALLPRRAFFCLYLKADSVTVRGLFLLGPRTEFLTSSELSPPRQSKPQRAFFGWSGGGRLIRRQRPQANFVHSPLEKSRLRRGSILPVKHPISGFVESVSYLGSAHDCH